MRNFIQSLIRLLIMTVVEGLSLLLMAWIIPGITIITDGSSSVLTEAISIAIVLAILNGLIRPILVLLTLPISIVTLGLFTLVINALMLLLASAFLPFFQVDSFWAALFPRIPSQFCQKSNYLQTTKAIVGTPKSM